MEMPDDDEPITIKYLYDDSGELYGMDYNGNGYFGFIKNLQGDIVSIIPLDSESNVELNIEYDAWGKPIFEESSLGASFVKAMIMAAVNVGYRGYFYDFETELYYLRSRYYDPEIGRFINADDTDQLKVPSEAMRGLSNEALTINLFAYCGNNPIMRIDSKGQMSVSIIYYLMYLNYIGNIILITNAFGKNNAYGARTFPLKDEIMGHMKVKFEATYKGIKLYEFIDYFYDYRGLIIAQIAERMMTQFKNDYGREFLLSIECIIREIYEHFVGYMWSIKKSGYKLPNYMKIYGAWASIKGGGFRDSIKNACVDADIYEKDVYDQGFFAKAESKEYDYFNGINSVYKSTRKDPYYYPKTGERKNKYNPEWNKDFFKLKGGATW